MKMAKKTTGKKAASRSRSAAKKKPAITKTMLKQFIQSANAGGEAIEGTKGKSPKRRGGL